MSQTLCHHHPLLCFDWSQHTAAFTESQASPESELSGKTSGLHCCSVPQQLTVACCQTVCYCADLRARVRVLAKVFTQQADSLDSSSSIRLTKLAAAEGVLKDASLTVVCNMSKHQTEGTSLTGFILVDLRAIFSSNKGNPLLPGHPGSNPDQVGLLLPACPIIISSSLQG